MKFGNEDTRPPRNGPSENGQTFEKVNLADTTMRKDGPKDLTPGSVPQTSRQAGDGMG